MTKPNRPVLLIIDMINDFQFDYGPILAEQAKYISHKIYTLKRKIKNSGGSVIYINDHYQLWQADYQKIAKKCKNNLSEKIIQKLYPEDDDYFLIKPKHSAFYGTALNTLLFHLKCSELYITGVAGNICVLFTANDAYMREYQLFIPQDCIASNTSDDNKYALRMMENVLKANTQPSDQISFS
ncbi:isochorismatase family cysteine hydrolase [Metabacillus sp. HB246100]|uniref:isochorismatase family cysteine hydrolase n=1 Tax=Bacillus weihaiensis TaxID=1547283 RepID=UPI0023566FD6|nr:isochorismatase family cysteine hydrolase [Bacillus weihaiensis]